MKICIHIMVLLFFTFLAAPTLVSLLDNDETDTSMVYSVTEEEIHKESKEVKAGPQYPVDIVLTVLAKKSAPINSKYLRKHNNVSGDIFLPPPKVV